VKGSLDVPKRPFVRRRRESARPVRARRSPQLRICGAAVEFRHDGVQRLQASEEVAATPILHSDIAKVPINDPKHWRDRAEGVRTVADDMTDPDSKAKCFGSPRTMRSWRGVARIIKERCESAMREAVGLRQPCSDHRTSTRRNLLPKTKSTPRWTRRQSYSRRVAIVQAAFVVAFSLFFGAVQLLGR
jgi:hypothetical protein